MKCVKCTKFHFLCRNVHIIHSTLTSRVQAVRRNGLKHTLHLSHHATKSSQFFYILIRNHHCRLITFEEQKVTWSTLICIDFWIKTWFLIHEKLWQFVMYSRKKIGTSFFISIQIILQKWNWYQSSWIIVYFRLMLIDALKLSLSVYMGCLYLTEIFSM